MNKTIFIIIFSGLLLLLYMVSFFIDRASNNGICFVVRLPITVKKELQKGINYEIEKYSGVKGSNCGECICNTGTAEKQRKMERDIWK